VRKKTDINCESTCELLLGLQRSDTELSDTCLLNASFYHAGRRLRKSDTAMNAALNYYLAGGEPQAKLTSHGMAPATPPLPQKLCRAAKSRASLN
jgi:hypothetical protein